MKTLTKKEINAIIEFQSNIQDELMLMVEDAYKYYESTFWGLGKSKSTKTYEDGLMTAMELITSHVQKIL